MLFSISLILVIIFDFKLGWFITISVISSILDDSVGIIIDLTLINPELSIITSVSIFSSGIKVVLTIWSLTILFNSFWSKSPSSISVNVIVDITAPSDSCVASNTKFSVSKSSILVLIILKLLTISVVVGLCIIVDGSSNSYITDIIGLFVSGSFKILISLISPVDDSSLMY